MAGTVGGLINRFAPVGSFAPILAGLIIKYIGKNNAKLRDFGTGVMIGGAASAFGGIVGQITGGFMQPKRQVGNVNQISAGGRKVRW